MKKLQDNYNYHDWSEFMVSSPKDAPKKPHFAVVMFDTRVEWSPSYDDLGHTSCTVDNIQYFAFPDKELLSAWILRASKDGKKFFFFEVKKLGEVELKVNVDVEV